MEGKNKYYDCITHLRLGRGTQEIQNKAMAISGLQCRGRLVDPAGRPLQSLCAKQLNLFSQLKSTDHQEFYKAAENFFLFRGQLIRLIH